MKRPIPFTAVIFALGILTACDDGSGGELAFKQVQCAQNAGMGNQFSMKIVVKDGEQQEIFVPGNGVSQAQADRANACMAS